MTNSFKLEETTRTLVVFCAFSDYEKQAEGQQLEPLTRLEDAVEELCEDMKSARFTDVGVQTEYLSNLERNDLIKRLEEIREAVSASGRGKAINMVLFWGGHGNNDNGTLCLAVKDTKLPIALETGINLRDVALWSGIRSVQTWSLCLESCYAGEGLRELAEKAGQWLKAEGKSLKAYSALSSCKPYQAARDGVLMETIARILQEGPSANAYQHAQEMGGGLGEFSVHNRLLSLHDLAEAIKIEYRIQPNELGDVEPWSSTGGGFQPRLFPNPRFKENAPSRLVEDAYRPVARPGDFDNHFFPKARGIVLDEGGWHFTGRVAATRAILKWLQNGSQRLYVLAGDAGTGKSALLGRLIALADPEYRDKAKDAGWNLAHDEEAGTLPELGCIDAAISLRALTQQTLEEELLTLLRVGLRDRTTPLQEQISKYRRADQKPPCIVLDALDEAESPWAIIRGVIHPLVREAGFRVLVATRRSAAAKDARDLLEALGKDAVGEEAIVYSLDLDEQGKDDIRAYAGGRLLQHYGPAMAAKAAKQIAEHADKSFLLARMATSSLLRSRKPLTDEQLQALIAGGMRDLISREWQALDGYFQNHFYGRKDAGATTMLAALAWGEGEGIPIRDGIWAAMATAISAQGDSATDSATKFEQEHIEWLLREAGSFIQEAGDGEQAVYRLFHASLSDYFRHGPFMPQDGAEAMHERLACALAERVEALGGWSNANLNPYLVRHMPAYLARRAEQKGLNALLLDFDWVQARLQRSGIGALLGDYQQCRDADPATAYLQRILRWITPILSVAPNQLVPQVLGCIEPGLFASPAATLRAGLAPQPIPSLDAFLERAQASINGTCWVSEPGDLRVNDSLIQITRPGFVAGCVALSADGHTVVSGGVDGTVRVWDARTGEALQCLQGHEGEGESVALNADGRIVVSGGPDQTVRVWDAWTGEALQCLRGHEQEVTSVAVSADGRIVVSGSRDETVRVWDAQTGQALQCLRGHEYWVSGVALSADGRIVVSGGRDKTVRVWDAQTGQALQCLRGHEQEVTSVAVSADGRIVVSGSRDETMRVWDAQTGQALQCLRGHKGEVWDVALSADGRTVVSGGQHGTVGVWDAQTGQALLCLRGYEWWIESVAVSADGRTVVSGGQHGTVRVWDARIDQTVPCLASHEGGVRSVAVSADGRTGVSGGEDGTVRVWDVWTGQALQCLQGHEGWVESVAVSADGRIVVSGGRDKTVRVWDAQAGQTLPCLRGHEGGVRSVAVSADGCTAVSGGWDRTVRVWNAQTGQTLQCLQGHAEDVNSVAVSADGRIVVSGGRDKTVRVWDARTGQALQGLRGHIGGGNSVAVSADGRTVVSGGWDRTVRVWDAQAGQALQCLEGHAWAIISVALSADGRIVVSGSKDKTVRVWDAQSGKIQDVLYLDDEVSSVALAEKDGQPAMIVVVSGGAIVRFRRVQGA